jgi:hypothetical protein
MVYEGMQLCRSEGIARWGWTRREKRERTKHSQLPSPDSRLLWVRPIFEAFRRQVLQRAREVRGSEKVGPEEGCTYLQVGRNRTALTDSFPEANPSGFHVLQNVAVSPCMYRH